MKILLKAASFSCISGHREEKDEQVKQKMQKLESIANLIMWFFFF